MSGGPATRRGPVAMLAAGGAGLPGPGLLALGPGLLALGPGLLALGPGLLGAGLLGPAGRAGGPAAPAIGRLPARELARRELARSIYQQPWWDRLVHTVNDWLNSLFGGLVSGSGIWPLVLLAVLAVVIVSAVLFWIGPTRRARHRPGAPLLQDRRFSADDHRRLAAELAAAADYAGAIIEGMRAIAVGLEDRGILPPRPGRTAAELAVETAAALPALAAELREVARLFDDVRYGDRPGTQAGYQRVRQLDASVRAAKTASAGSAVGSLP